MLLNVNCCEMYNKIIRPYSQGKTMLVMKGIILREFN